MSYKFDALVSILNWMEMGETVTPHFLRDQLAVSERTAFRYLQTLEGAGFPIYFDKRRGSYRFTDGYSLRKPNLTVAESLALALARVSLKGMNAGLEEELQQVEEKLAGAAYGLPAHIVIAEDEFTADIRENFLALNNAIVSSRTVAFDYRAASTGKETRREVDPCYLYFSDGLWTLRGYCHTRQEMRAFSLDRMTGLTVLDRHFVRTRADQKEEHAGTFGRFVSGAPVEVTLIFSPAALPFLLRRKWHPSQRSRELADGRLEMTFRVNGILGIRPWIYRWLPNVEVVAPLELVELVKQELDEARCMHR